MPSQILTKPSQILPKTQAKPLTKNQASTKCLITFTTMNFNIAKLTCLNLTYLAFSHHLALPAAPVVSLAICVQFQIENYYFHAPHSKI